MKGIVAAAAVAAALVLVWNDSGSAQQPARLAIRASAPAQLRAWDDYVEQRERAGLFRVRRADVDPSIPSRTIERLQQYHRGVKIWGAEVVRDADRGVPQALFGEVAPDLAVPTVPAFGPEAAARRLLEVAGAEAALLRPVELVVLPLDPGGHHLAYMSVASRGPEVFRVFVDAHTGAELLRYSEITTQSAVGSGRGVLGDQKKLSVVAEAGTYFADDQHRPPVLRTFDLRGNTIRLITVAFLGAPLFPSDRASDADNVWSDAAAVDAHAHIGWTYDYYYKRHGRRGLDGSDRQIVTLINGVPAGALSTPPGFEFLIDNAFWCGPCGPDGAGVMYFGTGVPAAVYNTFTGQNVAPLAGALDIAAHELTHGVVDSTSALLPFGEPGALNEGFADIMGTSAEFFFQPAGAARGQADYVIGEDAFRAFRAGSIDGVRSLANPQLYSSSPDHYARRYTGDEDSGGVHINAGIPGHAFYLAIEGGSNRTSGLAVQGVGAANREQIEKVFYRAFVFLLPPNATFATARAATIQAARDLYGSGSAPERAVTQAWTAVGVN